MRLFVGLLLFCCRLKCAVNGDERVLIETSIWFETLFGFMVSFENAEIVHEEANTPFKGFHGVVFFECMCLFLCEFDEFSIGDTGVGPMCWKVIGI